MMLAANMRTCREFHDIGYAELSRRLTELDRPIPPLGLRHIEEGKRRVDIDEWFALAEALYMGPVTLLLGADAAANAQTLTTLLANRER
jgi:hypothetical protein